MNATNLALLSDCAIGVHFKQGQTILREGELANPIRSIPFGRKNRYSKDWCCLRGNAFRGRWTHFIAKLIELVLLQRLTREGQKSTRHILCCFTGVDQTYDHLSNSKYKAGNFSV
jgi:hypothetical protein